MEDSFENEAVSSFCGLQYNLCCPPFCIFDHMARPRLIFNILLVLSKTFNCLVDLAIEGRQLQQSPERRSLLLE
jgi:hypothetical protein